MRGGEITSGGEIRRVMRLLAPQRVRVTLAVVLQFATVGAGIGLMATSAWLVSKAALHPSVAVLGLAIVGVRAFGISRGILRYFERVVSHEVTFRLLTALRVSIYRGLEPLAPARLAGRRSGDLLGRLLGDVDTLEHFYVRVVGPTSAAALVALLVAGLLAPRDGAVATVVVGGFVAGGVAAPWLAWRLGAAASARAVRLRGDLQARVVDGVQGLADLLVFGGMPAQLDEIDRVGRTLAREQVRAAAAAAFGGAMVSLVADLTALAALALAISAVRAGALDGAQLAVVTLLTLAAFEAVASLPAAYQALGATHEAGRRLFELTDASPPLDPVPAPAASPTGRHLEVRDLRFTYPGVSRPAIDGLNLSIAPGRLVAVVGPSGAGKSTLASLLLRFWNVSPGSILIDGTDVRLLAPDAVRSLVAFVPQRTSIFTGTLADNLRIARPSATTEEIVAASRQARLHEAVAGLPAGYDTWVGEQGQQLSGGERQRLALARAILKPSPFLVLDEPTANVDAITEREILAGVRALAATRGTLVITHRLVGLEQADDIVVLDRGHVVERGRYQDLVAQDGWFARMLRLQRSLLAMDGGS